MSSEAPASEAPAGNALVGAIISVLAVGGCVWWATRQEAPSLPTGPGHLLLLVVAIAVYAGNTVARGWRWAEILQRADISYPRGDALGLTVVGYMGNTVLPARGGEVLRVVLLAQRTGASRRRVLGSIIPERLLDAATLVALFSLLTVFGVAGKPAGAAPAIIGTAALIALPIVVLVYLRLRRQGRFEAFAEKARPVAAASRLLATRTGVVLALLTTAIWFSEGFVLLLVAQSIGVHLTAVEGVFIVVVASFFALIPAGPGYLGTFDAALLFGLGAVDVKGGAALGLVLLYRFVIFVPITITGAILVVTRYGGFRGLGARTRTAQAQVDTA